MEFLLVHKEFRSYSPLAAVLSQLHSCPFLFPTSLFSTVVSFLEDCFHECECLTTLKGMTLPSLAAFSRLYVPRKVWRPVNLPLSLTESSLVESVSYISTAEVRSVSWRNGPLKEEGRVHGGQRTGWGAAESP